MIRFITILFLFISWQSFSQEKELTRILFILDASNSMNAQWENELRIDAAKTILSNTVDELKDIENVELGLRVYGHQSPITATYQDCNDTKLEVGFSEGNAQQIKNKIATIKAKGTTPIARSLEAAAGDFPDSNSRNIIILITDGLEACDNDPCVIAQKLKDKGVSVTPFVIGLGMDLSYLEKFNCIGTFMEAETTEAFKNVMEKIISKAVLNTTVQINLNDIYNKPTETDVTMFLYESGTKDIKYTFVHTLNHYGNPDTLILDPELKYDLVVNTIPEVRKDNIEIKKFQHNTIEVDAPQGYLKIKFANAKKPNVTGTRIMLKGNDKTLNHHNLGEMDKYIVGEYQVEVLTIPRLYYDATIEQSKTEYIHVEAAGIMRFKSYSKVDAQLFVKRGEGEFERVYNFGINELNGDIHLQPGRYKLVYRKDEAKSSAYTMENNFIILSNKITTVQL